MLAFSILAAIDMIIGNRFGIGKEFERGFMFFGIMALSMIGMIILAPWIANLLSPAFDWIYETLHIDPSIIPASLFANDMGGAPLAANIAKDDKIGMFNALVVSSMMGCTISFNIPFALGTVKKENHPNVLLGLLCGIATIPVGCFIGGLIAGVSIIPLVIDLLPIIIFSGIITFGLLKFPKVCIKIFGVLGTGIKILITFGLVIGIIQFLTGYELIKGVDTLENGAKVCLNAAVFMTGAFPFIFILSKLLNKPMSKVGSRLGIDALSSISLVSSLATNATTFANMDQMNKRGMVLNSAFAVSGAFVFAAHLAFTMAFPGGNAYILPMIVGKLTAGVLAVILAIFISKRTLTDEKVESVAHISDKNP